VDVPVAQRDDGGTPCGVADDDHGAQADRRGGAGHEGPAEEIARTVHAAMLSCVGSEKG
jgi:hypothetical protein